MLFTNPKQYSKPKNLSRKMANYWKEKVLPSIKKVFDKNGPKKAAAAELIKTFEESKEQYTTEFEEKKTELQPKVLEIYEASSTQIKALVKEPKPAGLKKQAVDVQKFIDELAKVEFPGSKAVSEASTKFGPAYVPGPITFIFEKVSTFIVVEEKKKETPTIAEETTAVAEATTEVTEKDVVAGEKKEEAPAEAMAEKTEPVAEAVAPPAEPKVEEGAAKTEVEQPKA